MHESYTYYIAAFLSFCVFILISRFLGFVLGFYSKFSLVSILNLSDGFEDQNYFRLCILQARD